MRGVERCLICISYYTGTRSSYTNYAGAPEHRIRLIEEFGASGGFEALLAHWCAPATNATNTTTTSTATTASPGSAAGSAWRGAEEALGVANIIVDVRQALK